MSRASRSKGTCEKTSTDSIRYQLSETIRSAASAPADLLVNGTLIARGEVVVVDEDFGLRISEIVTDAAELGAVGA